MDKLNDFVRLATENDKVISNEDFADATCLMFKGLEDFYLDMVKITANELTSNGMMTLDQVMKLHFFPLFRMISRLINTFATMDENPPKRAMELIQQCNIIIDQLTSGEYDEILKSKQETH